MKTLTQLALFLLAGGLAQLNATGLIFNTDAADILSSSSTALSDSALLRVGTLSAAPGTLSTFADFESAFTLAPTVNTASFSGGEVALLAGPGTYSSISGQVVYGLVEDGLENAAFQIFTVPNSGFQSVNPSLISIGDVFIGSKNGNNITLAAVPEPSAFALLAGCFGLAAVMVRRRR